MQTKPFRRETELPDWLRNAPRHMDAPLATARSLRPSIEASAAEGERLGYVPDELVRSLAGSGLFGILVPEEFGGTEADPRTYIDVIEELSYADGSTGWMVMATTFCIANAAIWLGPSAARAMYESDAGFICAGQIAPLGKAVRVDGGYRVSGLFHFGSGSRLASWLLGAFVVEEDGEPLISPQGKPEVIWAFGPRESVDLKLDSWDVMGLAATASYDFEFLEQFVADDFVMFPFNRARRGGPSYEIGVSIGHVSWSLGVGMRILDEIKALARRKRREGRASLIDQPTFQRDFARATASMEAARAYVRSAFGDWLEAAERGEAGLEVRAKGRLAACWATEIAANVGAFAYLAAGSDGLHNEGGNNRLQRCFRDLYAGSTHRHVDHNVLLDCSSVLLGVHDPNLVL